MRAIIIEEAKFTDLVEELRARKTILAHENTNSNFLCRPKEISQRQWEGLIQNIHRDFHCVFVRWAQREGASCVR